MEDNEIVKALKVCNNPKGHRCSECPLFSRYDNRICKARVDKQAADLIEQLTKELDAALADIPHWQNTCIHDWKTCGHGYPCPECPKWEWRGLTEDTK